MDKKLLLLLAVLIITVIYLGGAPAQKDTFEGRITNMELEIGSLTGVGVYDRNCVDIGNGLTRCDAGIKTDKYGTLNFNYVHNMRIKPCIKPGDKLIVEILDSEGKAKVQRIW